ncbi:MAG TPA: hypothetical protein VL860_01520, partial [Planctomycetota bacterium]|nr:hypothetical protein [Planctomycetota bacterium]
MTTFEEANTIGTLPDFSAENRGADAATWDSLKPVLKPIHSRLNAIARRERVKRLLTCGSFTVAALV